MVLKVIRIIKENETRLKKDFKVFKNHIESTKKS